MDKDLKKEASVDISDLFVTKPTETAYKTFETSAPEFLKEASYEPGETMEGIIKRDWDRLINGLSDFVLAEQLTELELRGMGKPVGENYAAYFQETLKDTKKNRKSAEKKLFKLIPRHSQMDACEFFERVEEQTAKEAEAKERVMEEYPPAGVVVLEHKDVARKGLKKEAADGDTDEALDLPPGDPKMMEAVAALAQEAHAAGINDADGFKKWLEENHQIEALAWVVAHTAEAEKMIHDAAGMMKKADKKWDAGQYLRAKHNGADACVAHVDDEGKMYIVKVCGTMSPSYYTFKEAHETFTAVAVDETKDGAWAKSHGLSKVADVEADLKAKEA